VITTFSYFRLALHGQAENGSALLSAIYKSRLLGKPGLILRIHGIRQLRLAGCGTVRAWHKGWKPTDVLQSLSNVVTALANRRLLRLTEGRWK